MIALQAAAAAADAAEGTSGQKTVKALLQGRNGPWGKPSSEAAAEQLSNPYHFADMATNGLDMRDEVRHGQHLMLWAMCGMVFGVLGVLHMLQTRGTTDPANLCAMAVCLYGQQEQMLKSYL